MLTLDVHYTPEGGREILLADEETGVEQGWETHVELQN